jgi:phospholipase/carboxylesterase
MLDGPRFGPAAGRAPRHIVVLCHGYGSNGDDLISLAPYWAKTMPDALFVSPNAPDPCDMAPPGFEGRQWFPIGALDPATLGAGARRARSVLDHFIDAELTRHALPPDAYALMGFSQGAMMALFSGLRRAVAPRAILAYSGALVDPASLAREITGAPPVLLVHGEADIVVPPSRSREAQTALIAANVPVHALFIPGLAHGIDPAGLEAGAALLGRTLTGGASVD